jgi:hypothetical protein
MGFDLSESDLPLKVAFPVMMSNIINWLNPHRLKFSTLDTRAGEPFEIYLKPQTSTFYTRAPLEKWERHRASANPFRYTRTQKVGIYTISENDKQRYFTVNLVDEIESDIAAAFIEPPDEKTDSALVAEEISIQQPLWMFLILLVLGMLLLEWHLWLKRG